MPHVSRKFKYTAAVVLVLLVFGLGLGMILPAYFAEVHDCALYYPTGSEYHLKQLAWACRSYWSGFSVYPHREGDPGAVLRRLASWLSEGGGPPGPDPKVGTWLRNPDVPATTAHATTDYEYLNLPELPVKGRGAVILIAEKDWRDRDRELRCADSDAHVYAVEDPEMRAPHLLGRNPQELVEEGAITELRWSRTQAVWKAARPVK